MRLNAWKMKSDFAVANARAIGEREIRYRLLVDPVIAVARRIEQPENREQRGLAAARWPGDGHKLAAANFEMHACQSMRLDFIGIKNFCYAIEID